ncbi:RiPP maturation radical SAM C-methyltransferase [Actinoplanes sp. NPDC051851]|uniref:RiPP maturation radical SAM C-methyltransferase n=1 Tax=Actinoplanes sp. NPDC051851 TaxID=3154753 RepID=UPI0034435471
MTSDRSGWPVAVVAMPFLGADRPSIQAGLLTAIAREHGFPARSLHANLDFAARIGADRYGRLANHRGPLLGEWLFSREAFGDDAPDPGGKLLDDLGDDLTRLGGTYDRIRDCLLWIREEQVPAYLDELTETYPWERFRVVGFSCTFQQNAASFALARRLRRRHPGLVTVFGGANFDGEMGAELVRTVECADLAVTGEADAAFPALLAALADGADPGGVPGVIRRVGDAAVTTPPGPLPALDGLPPPDYGEYFDRAAALGLLDAAHRPRVRIPIETGRGCWWGAKHHCTFCGLNGVSMAFRGKSPDRVRAELAHQARRCGSLRFAAVDNILDPRLLTTLLPEIAGAGFGYELFYEIKANLGRGQVRTLARAGVTSVQPGLESLSTHVLGLMRKGTTAGQNVNLLRWARYYGMAVSWNLLWGFPGERGRDYAEQAALLPYLAHLEPPDSAGRIRLERFSPLFAERGTPVFRWARPESSHRFVYPERTDLERVAYFFDHELAGALPDEVYDDVRRAVAAWQTRWTSAGRPELTYSAAPEYVQIYDTRWPGREGTYAFEGLPAALYTVCAERPIGASAAAGRLKVPVGEVQELFTEFERLGLMFVDGPIGLSLALPAVAQR